MDFHLEHWNRTTTGPAISKDANSPRVIATFVAEYFPGYWPYHVERYTDHTTGKRAAHFCLRHPNGGTATFFVDIV